MVVRAFGKWSRAKRRSAKARTTTRKKTIPTMQYKIFSIPILNGEEEKTKAGI